MKARKALKRLTKVESLLSNIIDGVADPSNGLGDLLASAKESVQRAKKDMSHASDTGSRKPPMRAGAPNASRLTSEGRKKISLAAKKRWASARRKGVNPITGERLKKSA
jgi:hypothetical protein